MTTNLPLCGSCNGSGWYDGDGICRTCHGAGVMECIDAHHEDGCAGPIEVRMALSGTGIPYPRCEGHWSKRLDREQEIRERYPVHAPADFDPSYAGETWDED